MEPEIELFDVQDVSVAASIEVHLLGPYRIEANGEEIRTGFRSKARELLAFLLLHPQGKSVEASVDAIWPDCDIARGTEGFRTAVGNLRKVVRAATQHPKAQVIERVGDRYRVEPSTFSCDLWRLESALREAKLASGPEAVAPLERAAQECRGDLLYGAYYEWVEAAREDLRRRFVDAVVRLAELRAEAGAGEAALATLDEATRLDPYAEAVYRRQMALQLRLGQVEAVARTYKQLERRLAEIDADPDEATTELVATAIRKQPLRPGQPVGRSATDVVDLAEENPKLSQRGGTIRASG